MVKTLRKNDQSNLTDDPGIKSRLAVGGRKRGEITRMGKHKDTKKTEAGRHNYVVNEPEWGDSEIGESDDSMVVSQGCEREKRGSEFAGNSAKKIKGSRGFGGGREERTQEGLEFKIILRFGEERGISSMNPVKLTTVLRNQIGDIHLAKVLKDGNLLIVCRNEEQRDRAGRMKDVGRFKVVSTSRVEKGSKWSKGVIWGVPIGVTMEEIKSNLKGGTLKGARRIQVTREGERKDSEHVILEFEDEILPKKVTLGFLSYTVREYVPKPMRCYNCQRFGHTAKICKGRRRCARCGGNHEYGQCDHDQPKCCNCGGNHSVSYGGCEVVKREREIQQVRVQNKITYAEAVKMVNQRRGNGERIRSETGTIREVDQESEGKVKVDLKKLVTFIAGVINATMEVRSKTERIQIIVKAAVHHLEISGLTWEEVRNELSVQASQEQTWVG